MKRAAPLLLLACGGAAASPPPVVLPAASAAAPATASPPSPPAPTEVLVGAPGDPVEGPAFSREGAKVAVVVAGKLRVFAVADLSPISIAGGTFPRATGPLLVVGSHAYDPTSGAELAIARPPTCEGAAYSADGARVSSSCIDAKTGETVVLVQDTRSGATLASLGEFHTAAPIRSGAITPAGDAVFWTSRASGAFESISTKLVGPTMSSQTFASADGRWLFTLPDRMWVDGPATGTLFDQRLGVAAFTVEGNVDGAVFSPSGRRIAVLHAAEPTRRESVTITVHKTDRRDPLDTIPAGPVDGVAFSPDDALIAVLGGGKLRLRRVP